MGFCQRIFWPQLAFWRKEDSLAWWIVTQHGRKRRTLVACMSDPRWAHIRFIRLRTAAEVEAFAAALEREAREW